MVIFVASMSCFDQGLYEAEDINAMHEQLEVFNLIINSRLLKNTQVVLVLNKSDVFKQKIQEKDLKICFADYDGDNSYSDAVAFIKNKFLQTSRTMQKEIDIHVTCAIDEQDAARVFDHMKHTIHQW